MISAASRPANQASRGTVMAKTEFRPLHDRVVVKRIDAEEKTKGGIIIPDSAKDAEGYWYGDYYGVLSFVVNKDIVKNVPKDWADLKNSEYANTVSLAGDPRASNQAASSGASACPE